MRDRLAKKNFIEYIAAVIRGGKIYFGSFGKPEVVMHTPLGSCGVPKKTGITFGTAAGRIEYSDADVEGIDPEVQMMFYGNEQNKS